MEKQQTGGCPIRVQLREVRNCADKVEFLEGRFVSWNVVERAGATVKPEMVQVAAGSCL